MLRTFKIPISWMELIKRTLRETSADNVLGLAAQLAFYLLLALVPAIVFLIAIASFFPGRIIEEMIGALGAFAPRDVLEIIREQMREIAGGENTGILTFGLAMALWSSSAAMVAIVDALNRAYDIEEARPWWKVRLTAIALTIALALFVLVAFTLVIFGPRLGEWIASQFGLGAAFEWTWKIVQWPVVLALIAVAVGLVNYFAPDAEQDWEWVTPGAVVTTVLWLVASLGFRFYLTNFADYNATYGSLGGVIILMLWFYITGLAILVGAEMNAEIEHASPHGKEAGEKVPGEKKKLGRAAARAYEQLQQKKGRFRSQPDSQPRFASEPPRTTFGTYASGLLMFLAARWFRRTRE